ncbi:MAG TPA: hypothetical protein VIK93_11710, partial [Limnochordales bacterium]
MAAKRTISFGLQARLFGLVFVVATVISLVTNLITYYRERADIQEALANEALRAVRVFAAMLNVDEVVRLPYEPPGSALVRQYQS